MRGGSQSKAVAGGEHYKHYSKMPGIVNKYEKFYDLVLTIDLRLL
jgi:hypothetical protein